METDDAHVSSRILTIPNCLSLVRLALVPVFLLFIIADEVRLALLTLVVSSVTDYLDGVIARRFHQISRLGQLLDPAADRLFIVATLVGLAVTGAVPWWIVGAVVGRDVFLLALGVVLAHHGFGPLPVHHLGKVATFCLFLGLPLLMVAEAFDDLAAVTSPVGWAFLLWGTFLYWWAGLIYATETARVIRFPLATGSTVSDTLVD